MASSSPPVKNLYFTSIQDSIVEWWGQHQRRDLPWRTDLIPVTGARDETRRPDPYQIWVSEVMSQQTQMSTVIRYFVQWMDKFGSVEELASASEEEVRAVWSGMGYYRRAMHLLKGAKYLVEQHEQSGAKGPVKLPPTAAELLKVPGIGPYTSAAIASVCFDEPVCSVDGNVVRVLCRLRGELDFDPKVSKNIALANKWGNELITGGGEAVCKYPGAFNQGLMELGAGVCKPSGAPLCSECPLRNYCKAHAALETGSIPTIETVIPLKAAASKKRNDTVVCVVHEWTPSEDGGESKFIVVQREQNGLLGGMLEFPSMVHHVGKEIDISERDIAERLACGSVSSLKPIGSVKHIFSHINMEIIVFHVLHDTKKREKKEVDKRGASQKRGRKSDACVESAEDVCVALSKVIGSTKEPNNSAFDVDSGEEMVRTASQSLSRIFIKTESELKKSATSRLLWKVLQKLKGTNTTPSPKSTKKRSRSV